MAHPTELEALYAFLVALAVAALLTPLTMKLARAVGAIDEPRERGLSEKATPLLGGLAIFGGALVATLIWLPAGYGGSPHLLYGVIVAAAVIVLVGAPHDRFGPHPAGKVPGPVLPPGIVLPHGAAPKAT